MKINTVQYYIVSICACDWRSIRSNFGESIVGGFFVCLFVDIFIAEQFRWVGGLNSIKIHTYTHIIDESGTELAHCSAVIFARPPQVARIDGVSHEKKTKSIRKMLVCSTSFHGDISIGHFFCLAFKYHPSRIDDFELKWNEKISQQLTVSRSKGQAIYFEQICHK